MNELHGPVGQAVQASHINTLNMAAVPTTALNGLAPSSPLFVGRADELKVLAAERFVVVSGLAGVGKTELVLHHAQSRDFPGGRLFWNFHGYDRARRTTASDALDSFLRALGVVEIPPAEADKAALYRSLVATREPMLIVLDNACTAAQVRPLVVARHQVVVTSRHRLTGLDGATSLDLGVLTEAEATSFVGDAEVAALCGRLPLALTIMRALYASDPDNDWASDFRAARLSLLVNDDRDVRAAFDLSHQELSAEQQRFFRLLALHPGDVITLEGAAALAKVDQMTAKRLLRDLRAASLLDRQNRFHDLIHAYAMERVEAEPADIRTDAEDRLVRHFGERAVATLADPSPDNLAWFDGNVGVLSATTTMAHKSGRPAESVALAWALSDFVGIHAVNSKPTLPAAIAEAGWPAAVERAQGMIDMARSDDCLDEFLNAVYRLSAFSVVFGDGDVLARLQDNFHRVLEYGDKQLAGMIAVLLGFLHGNMGDYDKTIAFLTEALDIGKCSLSEGPPYARVHDSLALALHHAGRHVDAITHLEMAAAIHEEAGEIGERGCILVLLGEVHCDLGEIDRARRCWEEAVRLLDGTPFKMALATAKRSLAQMS